MTNEEGKKKVVYWLGAGASAHALPVVTEMPAAFRTLAHRIVDGVDPVVRQFPKTKEMERFSAYLNNMAEWSEQFGTIDTYARSLFLRKERELLAELKLHLGMYFLLEQALHLKHERPAGNEGETYWKRDRIDTRYMGWLALLLQPDAGISKRVNVVSWNYDLQIEHAVAIYRAYKDLSLLHSDPNIRFFPRPVNENTQYTTPPAVIRLNGIAGHAKIGDQIQVLYNGLHDQAQNGATLVNRLFELYTDYNVRDKTMLHAMADTFTFAWEGNPIANKSVDLACRVMQSAQILVVIGYSFPSFNRAIDKKLYQAFCSTDAAYKHVVIQNRSIDPDTFRQRLGQNGSSPNVLVEQNLEQFHIPSELF